MLELGVFLIALTALSFVAKDILSKRLLEHESPWAAAFYVFLTTFLLSFAWMLVVDKGIPQVPPLLLLYAAIAGVGQAAGMYFFLKALKEGRAAIVGPLGTLWALTSITVSVLFFHQPLSSGTIIGSILAFSGIVLVALLQHPKITISIAIAVLLWGTWAFAGPVIDALGPAASNCLISLFFCLAALAGVKAKQPLSFALPGFFNFLASACELVAIPMLGIVVTTSLMTPLYFLFMTAAGMVFFREKLVKNELIGLALVCIGITISTLLR